MYSIQFQLHIKIEKIHGPKNILPTYLDMLRMCFLMIMYIL